jgi:hypothetical protein
MSNMTLPGAKPSRRGADILRGMENVTGLGGEQP